MVEVDIRAPKIRTGEAIHGGPQLDADASEAQHRQKKGQVASQITRNCRQLEESAAAKFDGPPPAFPMISKAASVINPSS